MLATLALATEPVHIHTVRHRGDAYTVATVDLERADLELFGQSSPEPRTFDELAKHLESTGRSLVLAMNAGMYHTGWEPVGLHIEHGVQHAQLNTEDAPGNFFLKPNAVFLVDSQGARVVETGAYDAELSQVRLATQSGPALLLDGSVHPAFMPDSKSKLPRNGICASAPHTVHMVLSKGNIRFHDFATLFRDELGCTDALFLDGVVSAMWYEGARGKTHGEFSGILAVSVEASGGTP